MFFLEKLDDFLQGGVVLEVKPIPKGPFYLPVLGLLGSYGLRETEEWQSKIDKSILVIFEFIFSVDDLEGRDAFVHVQTYRNM